jgi:hypothetical protein
MILSSFAWHSIAQQGTAGELHKSLNIGPFAAPETGWDPVLIRADPF